MLPLDGIEGLEVTKGFARAIEKGMTIYATERYSSIGKLLSDLDPMEAFGQSWKKRRLRGQKAEKNDPGSVPRESQAEKRKKSLGNKDAELAAALAAVQQYRKEKLPEIDMSVAEDPEPSRIDISGAEKPERERKLERPGSPRRRRKRRRVPEPKVL